MGFNRFSALLAIRLAAIMLSLLALGYFILSPGYHAATMLFLALVSLLTFDVFRFVSRTNKEVSRFLDAARYADFGQRFNLGSLGAGFEELGDTFTAILERFRLQRTDQEAELRHLKALLEHVPVPLMSIHADQRVTLWNHAARRLFATGHVKHLRDLDDYGESFALSLENMQPGERLMAGFVVDGLERRVTVAASQLVIEGQPERLISLQDIQSELDGTQLEAWQDLVRVLTHEIMNSITPVASLAKTTVDLVEDAAAKVTDHPDVVSDLGDVRSAVDTVARRSDSLMNFVSSYRRLTRLPAPQKERILLADMFSSTTQLFASAVTYSDIDVCVAIEPEQLDLNADRGMLEQILINLLTNAQQALENNAAGLITLSARLNRRGHVQIQIEDNGPGIDPELLHRIFVPFFTTRREGSGVGLALARQIMIVHGGAITASQADSGGARFTLTF